TRGAGRCCPDSDLMQDEPESGLELTDRPATGLTRFPPGGRAAANLHRTARPARTAGTPSTTIRNMLRIFPLALVPALLLAAELKIDHATVAGTDLKQMQADLAAVGIPTVYGGPHSNHATEMALVSFPDGSYLELIAVQPGADPQAVDKHEWARFLKSDAVPCAWAARVKDLPAEVKRLSDAGIAVSPPVKSGRQRPDGVR